MVAKYSEFYNELKTSLPTSNLEQRKIWIYRIIDEDINLKELSDLLKCEHKVATRFLWFISEIGLSNPTKLLKELPYLESVYKLQYLLYAKLPKYSYTGAYTPFLATWHALVLKFLVQILVFQTNISAIVTGSIY